MKRFLQRYGKLLGIALFIILCSSMAFAGILLAFSLTGVSAMASFILFVVLLLIALIFTNK